MIRRTIRTILTLAILLSLSYCANMKAPGGGPKDIYAPKVIESEPANYSTRFHSKKIVLKFNEFVTVSDVQTEVFISPPLQNTPDIKTKGKSVVIIIDEELRDSTTYSIYFGKAIKDLTEGNPIENYNYVFSTGDYIDSLSVIGEVIDAFNLQARPDVLTMLYRDDNDTIPFDSLPYLVKPAYLTRTNPQGFFIISNIKAGQYMMMALADMNLSMTYDNVEEEIGFLDNLITPTYLLPEPDSMIVDSVMVQNIDTLTSEKPSDLLNDMGYELEVKVPDDSVEVITEFPLIDSIAGDSAEKGSYRLLMFTETDSTQRLLNVDKTRERLIRFIFRYPAEDILITVLTPTPEENWLAREWSNHSDTLWYYILSSEMDTISLKISLDTIVFDTASYSLIEKEIPQKKRDEEEQQLLHISSNTKPSFPYFKEMILSVANPIIKHDFSRFILIENQDTLQPILEIYGEAGRMIKLNHQFKENTSYNLFMPDSVVTDMLGKSNDTTQFIFKTTSYDDYGLYKIHIQNSSHSDQLIIQLLSEKEKLIREEILREDGTISWDFIPPGKYIIKAIGDLNYNGKWDTGNLLKKLQPEPVVYFQGVIEIRAGWSFEEDWLVKFK